MNTATYIAIGTSALALLLSLLAIWLDLRILRRHDEHHGLLRALHDHHLGGDGTPESKS